MADEKPVGRESDKFMLRFPEGMRDLIADRAKRNNRSMNSEIIARLAQTFGVKALDSLTGTERDVAIASSTAEAMLKALEQANRHGELLVRKMERIEAQLSMAPMRGGGGDTPLPRGEPEQHLHDGPKPKNVQIIQPGIVPPHDPT